MQFGELLREGRKQLGLSQQKMADTINVSRQAIAKWESGRGMPEITNLKAISKLFDISIDQLLSREGFKLSKENFLYESKVVYDIDRKKNFDIQLGVVDCIVLNSIEGEKLRIRLASNNIEQLSEYLKIKIDDNKGKIDISLKKLGSLNIDSTQEDISIFIDLPKKYIKNIELTVKCQKLKLIDSCSEKFEFDGEVSNVDIKGGGGQIELNSKLNMEVTMAATYSGAITINQISAISKIYIPEDYSFRAVRKGLATKLSFEENGEEIENFSSQDSTNYIEINGIKNELIIIRDKYRSKLI